MTPEDTPPNHSNDAFSDAFSQLKTFFSLGKASREALRHLREGVEIGIVIGGTVTCALFRQGDAIIVERREARNPDFVFSLQPETVSVLANQTKDEIGDVGLAVIKEMLAGDIRVQMPGGLFSVLRGGYVDVVLSGGAPVMKMLSQMGLGSPAKILGLFKNLRR